MDTRSGKRIEERMEIGSFVSKNGFFDGKYYHIADKFYDTASNPVKKNNLELPQKYLSEEPVYLGSEITVLFAGMLQNGEKVYFTAMLSPDGAATEDPLGNLLVDRVIKTGEKRYLMIAYDAFCGQPYLLSCKTSISFILNPDLIN